MRKLISLLENQVDDEEPDDLDDVDIEKRWHDILHKDPKCALKKLPDEIETFELVIKPPPPIDEQDWQISYLSYFMDHGLICVNFDEGDSDDSQDLFDSWHDRVFSNPAEKKRWISHLQKWISLALKTSITDLSLSSSDTFEPCGGEGYGVRLTSQQVDSLSIFDLTKNNLRIMDKILGKQ